MPAPATEEDDSRDWDGDQGRQTGLCNSVNVRFEKASWGFLAASRAFHTE